MKYAIIFNFSATQWIIGIDLGKKDLKKKQQQQQQQKQETKKKSPCLG